MSCLSILSESAVLDLLDRTRAADFDPTPYRAGIFDLGTMESMRSPMTVEEPPELVGGAGNLRQDEPENAIALHRWLEGMTVLQASDHRLWTTLCHGQFSAYVIKRWPLPPDAVEATSRVREHWFVKGSGLAGLRRNAISRLWWAAQLTYEPWKSLKGFSHLEKDDPYEYTRILLHNQDIYQGIVERRFGCDRRVLIAVLEVLSEDLESRGTTAAITSLAKDLNLMASYRELGVLNANALLRLIRSLITTSGQEVVV